MKRLISTPLLFIFLISAGNAQPKSVYGKVYAYKDLPLNKILVVAKKAKTETFTDSLGYFRIACTEGDKLEFSGTGFQKVKRKPEDKEVKIEVKMIFNESSKNVKEAVAAGHVSEESLLHSINEFHEYNYHYYNYADIFTLIDKIYEDNFDIKVNDKTVFVRPDNKSNFPPTPAIFMVNGKVALEIADILPANIQTLKVIADGSSRFGRMAANGVVIITTGN